MQNFEIGNSVEIINLAAWEGEGSIDKKKYVACVGVVEKVSAKKVSIRNEHGNLSVYWVETRLAIGSGPLGGYAVRKI